ncbi:uncharacterized protein PGTG_07500 [Puccinia graminis f. sp. tritici CRL 75-36-700-3]|uniref:Uncharacterized protein n=1 Tax=Puccinia graminis f. sp. tritici (strain CRL 75-36-700-3 / race SCCL) TaxID=418459 RepID=E3KD70_PUCGT|nr:uncharacterized protein PGTG_07500 [Puccinia graminis f. sp. tritici CRL 75-36-700-3]EFP82103.2 hypothetical protein PGTG_07500 [Puccinia graminis f. sp. tritici CRL 75-36-700-3]
MRFTFLTLTASLLLLNHQAFAGEDNIDPPLNPTSTIQSFSFQRKLSWTNQDFDVTQDGNNAHIMSVEAHLKDKWMKAHFALDLVLPSGERVGIKVEGKLVHCGFTQTYKISNGVQLLVDPRGTSTDRWYIKKSGYIKQAYTWHRHFQGLSGVVTGEHGRKVAYFSSLHSRFPLGYYSSLLSWQVSIHATFHMYSTHIFTIIINSSIVDKNTKNYRETLIDFLNFERQTLKSGLTLCMPPSGVFGRRVFTLLGLEADRKILIRVISEGQTECSQSIPAGVVRLKSP